MKYRNKKTGAEINTDLEISGGNWEKVKGRGKNKDAENVTPSEREDNE